MWLKRDVASFLKRMELGTGHSFRDSVVQHNWSMRSSKHVCTERHLRAAQLVHEKHENMHEKHENQ